MPGIDFGVRVEEQDGVVALRMSGDVDRTAHERLDEAYATTSGGSVVLDFSDVDYINSTGIAVIVGILAKARAEGRQVRAFGLSDHYRQIFQITRIADFMAIYDDEATAVAAG
ncbi:MAG: STAS domain-containing protein [Acidimicrobiia bacterium]